jgi:DNA-binding NtrC family response regulator
MSTILFVEEEHAPRAVFGDFLGNEGFTVLKAADMAEALDACDSYRGQVDLLISDTPAGTRLASRLAARYPRMSLLFIGDSEKTMSAHEPPPGHKSGCLHKPFTAQMLLKSVLGLIDSGMVASKEPCAIARGR